MLAEGQDDVSNIHRRWSFTRITPGSLKASYAMALACAAVVIAVSDLAHLGAGMAAFALRLPLGLAVLAGLTLLDFAMLRGTPVNALSKVVHVTSFSLLLWALTVLVGILADALFGKAGGPAYVVAGMLLAAGLRVGIFTSVFGAGMARAVAICLVQPLAFFFALAPAQSYGGLADPAGLGFGALFVALAIVWTALADRAGRPQVQSTFRLLQAFLSAWTENKTDGMEEYFESKASAKQVGTSVLKLEPAAGRDISIVLPDVHPGPFGAVGGSNLPYVLHEEFGKRALVMHSVSDHSLNIPSGKEVARYVEGLRGLLTSDAGGTCTEPVQRRKGDATATAIAFGKSALVFLSLAPKGMEDVPSEVRHELQSHARAVGFASLLVIDCHNAMGKQIGSSDRSDLLSAALQCLDDLKGLPQGEFSAGFASLADIADPLGNSSELGQAGLAVLVVAVHGKKYAIGWADSNNMENGLRDRIIARVNSVEAATMLEVCTSDTHSTSGKRTRQGYFALGTTGEQEQIAGAYAGMCEAAARDAKRCQFDLLSAMSEVKVMGAQFGDYSAALDRSLNITKVFVGITFAAFVALQVLA